MNAAAVISSLVVGSVVALSGVKAQAADVFLERKLMMFPSCREKAEAPEKAENLMIIALNDPAEVNAKPCDRNCMLEKRYSVADAKNQPILNELLAAAKTSKPVTGAFKADGFIGLPDLGVCVFVDSVNSKIEVAGKTYAFNPRILVRLRNALRVPPPKY